MLVSGPLREHGLETSGILRLCFLHLLPHEKLCHLRNVTHLNSEMHATGSSGERLDAVALAPGLLRRGLAGQSQQVILLKLGDEQGFLALET